MRNIVILGAGAGGTIVANQLRRELDDSDFRITIIDKDEQHHYQAGYLFIPFGIYSKQDVLRPKREFIPKDVDFVLDRVTGIEPDKRQVVTEKSRYNYDWLVVSTGCRIAPEEVDGLMETWQETAFDYYTLQGALNLRKKLKYFESGKVVLNIADTPFKCPIAPIEFVFMADAFFTRNGVRDRVEIELVTPLDGIFTKPVATRELTRMAEKKNIRLRTQFTLSEVNGQSKTIVSASGEEVGYDLLVSIPPNMGDNSLIDSGVADPMGFMRTDRHTLKSQDFDRIDVLGDVTNVPTSKAGSVAHYESYTVTENILREIDGYPPKSTFDGHATCFLASGYEKATLLDFNYTVEPLPGKFPFPGLGPFNLLSESLSNYWGKMLFRWVYWNLMMPGNELPLEPQMNLAGKVRPYIPAA
ncbi:MAG: NAD(P)/FAD-dependent oxidoreductase [Desulfobacterales bacterium]|nr:NAD(P)/FAD-dependent oxidoreductase [Desulfobacterales bacterium]